MDQTPPVRAIVGARVSHVQGDEKTSHITQRTKGDAYAESQGWTVVGAFEDLDVSAIKLSPWQRPDLAKWLSDDKSQEWDALIFAKTDRVFRSAADCITLAKWCEENRKILVLIDDGIKLDYFNPEDAKDAFAGAMSRVFLILASVFAEIEGQRFVQRARDRVNALRSTERWGYGIPPFGYLVIDNPNGPGKALGLDAEQQRVLHWVARCMIFGASLVGMVAFLNDMAVLSPRDWIRVRKGSEPNGTRWTVDKLKAILTRPSTQGIKMAKDKPVLDAEGQPVRVGPASFDDETWNQLQVAVALRTQSPRDRVHSVNPQLGVCKCSECGKNLRQRSQTTPAGKTHRYYLCGNSPVACAGVSIVADVLDTSIERTFLKAMGSHRVKVQVWQAGSDFSHELTQTEDTITQLREDRAMGLFPTPTDQATYRSQMQALIAKRDALAAQPIVKSGWTEVMTDETYSDVWKLADVEGRRKMVIDAGITYYLTPRGQVVSNDQKLNEELVQIADDLGVKTGDATPL